MSTAGFGGAAAPTRQARSAETRTRILDAATAAFVRDGIAAVSLRDVAGLAGVTHPGLLRHFASKDALLGAVVERLDRANTDWIDAVEPAPSTLGMAALAERNTRTPGYLELYTALAGEATSTTHPAHEHLRERYARVRASVTEQLAALPLGGDLVPATEATLLIAAWDGLQLQQRYAPALDLVTHLERHERRLLGDPPPVDPVERSAPAEPIPPTVVVEEEPAGRLGRERRASIAASAIELFARDGYHGTSLRELAERAGISKSTLVHHIGTKDELLTAVLRLRDRRTITPEPPGAATAAEHLFALADAADRTARDEPGLIELYAVLSCEGATPGHPAHDYFARRFRESRRYFLSLLRRMRDEGTLRDDRDPAHESAWLPAVWDGLQIQWSYDHSIDVGAHLRAYFRELVVPGFDPGPAALDPSRGAEAR
ncbi:TetR/AcrR family transcriptional regulator [Agromyces lapidis]|uniref:TetR/AcrR family transcriptional regulator n=1 Tax=Agromyces lapidis TaxID=279574 RepID=A0ABV5SM22_9MICO|nr:TetR/AcrR family transcriptional regulator [Agromyces lapidis]